MSQSTISTSSVQENHNERPDLSVIIVSWNVRDLLVQCLAALFSPEVRDGLKLEVIVVDNASTDDSTEAACGFPQVKVVQNCHNIGYGRANNQGFQAAHGRHLLVLNPDTMPQPGSLEALLRFADSHPNTGIISPRLLNPDGSTQSAAFNFPTLPMYALDLFPVPRFVPGRIRYWLARSELNGRYPQGPRRAHPFKIDHPLGACMLINGEAYRQVGGFDPRLFMYSEEIDLALRYGEAGWQCWQVPVARVVHLGGQSTAQAPERMQIELWRSRLYIYRRYYTPFAQFALTGLLLLAQAREALLILFGRMIGRVTRLEAQRRGRMARALARLVLSK